MAENYLLVFATFVAVLVATIGIILTNQKTRESNETVKKEIQLRLRPWISRYDEPDNPRIIDPRQGIVGPANPTGLPEPPLLVIRITNHGSLPALHIRTSFWLNQNSPDGNTFQPIDPNSDFALASNEPSYSRIVLDHQSYVAATTNILFYGYRVDYTDINGIAGYYELIGRWDRSLDAFIRSDIG